jgi:chromosome segregation and condensation protein ScpB
MATDSALTLIDAEIAKLKQVCSLLAHAGKIAAKIIAIKSKIKERKTRLAAVKAAVKANAKPAAKAASKNVAKKSAKARKHRVLSPEARQRIGDAQRKRWAAQKATAPKHA